MKRKFVKTKTELIFTKLVDQTNNKRVSCLVEENTITCSINILTLRALKILIEFMLVFHRTYELQKVLPYHQQTYFKIFWEETKENCNSIWRIKITSDNFSITLSLFKYTNQPLMIDVWTVAFILGMYQAHCHKV